MVVLGTNMLVDPLLSPQWSEGTHYRKPEVFAELGFYPLTFSKNKILFIQHF